MDGGDNIPQENPGADLRAEKLHRLIRERDTSNVYNPKYSKFIRRARLILPLIALAIFAIVFVWNDVERNKIIPAKELASTPTIGKNELVNPRFESTDSDNQPYTITAKRAVQNKEDNNLVMLEKPLGDMKMNNGDWIAIEADRGSFRQDSKILLLRGKVRLYHDKGYQLEMEELDVDLNKNTAFSKVDVAGQGPEGTLAAKGLEGDSTAGKVIFNGPAKLILTSTSGSSAKVLP
jgi:lipopolysaccharide export system protein LptC